MPTPRRFLERFLAKDAKDARQPPRGDDDDTLARCDAVRAGNPRRRSAHAARRSDGGQIMSNVNGQIDMVGGGRECGNATPGFRLRLAV